MAMVRHNGIHFKYDILSSRTDNKYFDKNIIIFILSAKDSVFFPLKADMKWENSSDGTIW